MYTVRIFSDPIPKISLTSPFSYNASVPMRERIDTVVSWFQRNPALNLGLLYYHEPDHTGHSYGPDSPEVRLG